MKKIINPIAYYNEYKLLFIGCITLILGCFLSYHYSIYHHGILQAGPGSYPWWKYAFAIILDVMVLTIFTWVLGKIINSKTRFIDLLNVNLIARIPLHLLPVVAGSDIMHEFLESSTNLSPNELMADPNFLSNMIAIFFFSMISLLLLSIFFLLLIMGFRTAVHVKKWYHYLLLVIVIIIADILSRIINSLY